MSSRNSLTSKTDSNDTPHQTLTGLVRLLARQSAREVYHSLQSPPQIDNNAQKDSTDEILGT